MRIAFWVLEGGEPKEVTVEHSGNGTARVSLDGRSIQLDAHRVSEREYHFLVEDRSYNLLLGGTPPKLEAFLDGRRVPIELLDESQVARRAAAATTGAGHGSSGALAVRAPMPGKVVKCLVSLGDEVVSGQGIVVVEAMKMENELRTPRGGVVKAIKVEEGQTVEMGVDLVLIE
jgi:biotin carboxyl carrier protein